VPARDGWVYSGHGLAAVGTVVGTQEPSLYGRMDLRWDGTGPPKAAGIQRRYPRPRCSESSVVQWEWLRRCAYPDADQFNSIHEALIAPGRHSTCPTGVHFGLHARQR